MNDDMTEVICQAAFDRHVLIDRTDCEALAAAARAFIGDEIADLRLDRPDEQRITVREVEVWNRAIDAATTTIRNGAKK
jgi:hypothetical protein